MSQTDSCSGACSASGRSGWPALALLMIIGFGSKCDADPCVLRATAPT
jgi:hypothetical protein